MNNFSRRDALKLISISTAATLVEPSLFAHEKKPKDEKHYITLSFDDGFKKSSIKTAEIYEKYHLSACINVIATAHLPDFVLPNEYHRWPAGDFVLWNELKQRGHEIMMHDYKHSHLDQLPLAEAKEQVLKCIDYFSKNLKGFEAKESIFNFPFNASTPELEEWLPTQVKAFRTGGNSINQLPHQGQTKLTCGAFGPENCEAYIDGEIEKLLARSEGWLIINTHGLDDEGWGPVRSEYLDNLLQKLIAIETVEIIPAGKALSKFK
ncbi:MAG TPA: polysaccharide deacetylase family protein [Chitinophagaceae bacterium]|jgi:peptidoglycan/xylan/chitin deacetylase (PgdA/CDA1 family)